MHLVIGIWISAPAQTQELRSLIESHVDGHQKETVGELVRALSIPSVAADRENIRRKAASLRELLERRRFDAQLLETEGNPLVYGGLHLVVDSRARSMLDC